MRISIAIEAEVPDRFDLGDVQAAIVDGHDLPAGVRVLTAEVRQLIDHPDLMPPPEGPAAEAAL